jgi:hypothetical protein
MRKIAMHFYIKKIHVQYEACLIAEDAYINTINIAVNTMKLWIKPSRNVLISPMLIDNKSTAYLKSGDFITWKYLIDKAVEYDFTERISAIADGASFSFSEITRVLSTI